MSSYSTHAEILRQGVTAWNAWRDKNPSTVPDLQGVALALSEDSLNGGSVNLREARLQNSVLRFATLPTADLEGADMSGADLMHARLDQANLSAVNLSNARLDHANFAGATLTKVNLCGARLRFANFSTANLQAADMSDADLTHARLDQTNLSAANFANARLDYANFAGAKLAKVNLRGASLQHAKNLTETQIKESTGDPSTILPPHLQGSVSWSPTTNPTFAHFEFSPLPSDRQSRWSLAQFVQRATLATIAFSISVALIVWLLTNETPPLDMLGDDSDTGLRATVPDAPTKATSARRLTADTTSVSEEEYEAPESTAMAFVETPPAAWPHAIVPDLPFGPSKLSTLAYTASGQTALSSGAETPPTQPARNPARGQHIETANTIGPSNAEIPPKPFRNPLR